MSKIAPELLSPAGDWPGLVSAVSAGADAVYFGAKMLNMREGAGNFDLLEIKKVMKFLKKAGKKGYLTLNTVIFDRDIDDLRKVIERAKTEGVDAVIAWDHAVIRTALKEGLEVHLSTQASVANREALKVYADMGVSRVVLARECSLKDISNMVSYIRKGKINCGIETFVHGAMCVSVSGRCFLSQGSFCKSANRGACLQPCRRLFRIVDSDEGSEYVVGSDFILSPKDLCSIGFVDKLISSGISAFKIEGRARSPEYAKVVTSAYRRAIDASLAGRYTSALRTKLEKELKGVYNRGFSSGFYFGPPGKEGYGRDIKNESDKIYLGEVSNFYRKINVAEMNLRNEAVRTGDRIFISGKTTPVQFMTVGRMQIDHRDVSSAKKGEAVAIEVPFPVRPKDKVFLWRERPDIS